MQKTITFLYQQKRDHICTTRKEICFEITKLFKGYNFLVFNYVSSAFSELHIVKSIVKPVSKYKIEISFKVKQKIAFLINKTTKSK